MFCRLSTHKDNEAARLTGYKTFESKARRLPLPLSTVMCSTRQAPALHGPAYVAGEGDEKVL
jgi:hypothetical protein